MKQCRMDTIYQGCLTIKYNILLYTHGVRTIEFYNIKSMTPKASHRFKILSEFL